MDFKESLIRVKCRMCSVEGDLIGEHKLGAPPSSPQNWLCGLSEVTKPLWAIISELELDERDFPALKIYGGGISPSLALCCVSFLKIKFLYFFTFSFNCFNKNFIFMGQKKKISISL